MLQENKTTDYIDEDLVKEEVKGSRRLFSKMGWPVIDVTRRSIEETSVAIINMKNKFEEEKVAKSR
jgi:regulator of PEP synthase PpsR (kinase-PPPase family)